MIPDDFSISGSVKSKGSGTSSYVITADLNIKYGSSDAAFTLNLDSILAYS